MFDDINGAGQTSYSLSGRSFRGFQGLAAVILVLLCSVCAGIIIYGRLG